jgi:hypothetical protein
VEQSGEFTAKIGILKHLGREKRKRKAYDWLLMDRYKEKLSREPCNDKAFTIE